MTVDVITFGCRLNAYESEVVRRHARDSGLEHTVVVNTCAVTAEAVAQARQAIRKLARERPDASIVVTGCAAQIDPATFAAMPEVHRVLGNDDKLRRSAWDDTRAALERAALAPDFGISATEKLVVNDIMAVRECAPQLIDGLEGRARAVVQVQNGCDHRCTFCIIPYGRGNSRSVPMGDVVAQIRSLCETGYREVVLTGVDLTSYGADLPGTPQLGTLVRQILKHVPSLARLRLSSIDSVEVDRELMDAIAEDARVMPHLHLSLQAGDDLILKRMKRRHTRAEAISFCDQVRRLRPDMVFGGDVIAGFPTESEAMFNRSLDLVDECGLTYLHVFPYSARPGTPAARMPQVAHGAIKERARRLREKGAAALARHLNGEVGARRSLLTELNGIGRTPQFTPVRLSEPLAPGLIVDVVIAGHDGRQLLAC